MNAFSLTAVLFGCLLLTTSCSFGEDLEKEALTDKSKKTSQVKNDSSNKDKSSGSDYEDADTELYAQADSDGEIIFPKTKSVSIESKNNDDGQKILEVALSLENGSVEDFDFTYKWFYNDEEILGEVDIFIPWNDDYKKGDKIRVQIIPPNVDEESFLVTDAEFVVPNSPPVITSEPPTEITGEDKLFEYDVESEDPDGDQVEIALKKSPAGMTIEPATGLIKWDFSTEQAGSEYKIEIVASDPDGESYIQEITLTIPQSEETDKAQATEEEPTEDELLEEEPTEEEPIDEELIEEEPPQ